MSARSLVVLAALAAASCVNKPSGFGIDVEARTSMLQASTRNAIVTARLLVTGAETFTHDIAGVAKAAQSGAMKFRYVPGVHAGTLTIRVEGLDGGGTVVAAGISQPITILDGKAVDAVLFLATNGNGTACMAMSDCISNNCVDGVCCESACDGVCETCNLPGEAGVCNPQMQGTDPDSDCAAKTPPVDVDGGTNDDGGMTGGMTTVSVNLQACAGTCNGSRACKFPDTTQSCGMNYCPVVSSVGAFFCDGNGSCNEQDTMCSDYVCASGACKLSCNTDADCQSTDFCNLNINKCVPKHGLGTPCTGTDQCASGFCSSGFCCNTDCSGTGQSCSVNPGQCQCQSHPCPNGIACQLFYKDGDNDMYGDASGTIANGNAVAGCVGDAPPTINNVKYVADNTDCNDADNRQHPGQTGYFDSPSNVKGDYDYNCDGDPSGPEKFYPEFPGGTCGQCSGGIGTCTKSTNSCNGTGSSAFACGFVRTSTGFFCPCCQYDPSAFLQTVGCGVPAMLYNCGSCSGAGAAPAVTTSPNTKQACH